MYGIVVFLHVLGAALLISAVVIEVTGLLRAQRSATVEGVRRAVSGTPVADKLVPIAMPGVWIAGIYLWSRHGFRGQIRWTSGWIVVSASIVLVMSVIGPLVIARRSLALHRAVDDAPPGPVTPQLHALRSDPVLAAATFFGAAQLVNLLYLMTNKPTLAVALTTTLVAAVVGPAVAMLTRRAAPQHLFQTTVDAPRVTT